MENLSLFNEEKPKLEAISLRPYQQEAIVELKKGWLGNRLGNTFNRQLLVLATGLGKTICFADLAKWVSNDLVGRVLVLAHRDELLGQAEQKMQRVFGEQLSIGREQGTQRASVAVDRIVTASVATLGRKITHPSEREFIDGKFQAPSRPNDRLTRFPKDHFKLVIVDEAHHATADTYQQVLDYFAPPGSDTWVLGVTATPKRTDKESLHKIFSRVAYKMDIVDGTKLGWLTPIVGHRISSKTDLDGIRTTAGDFNIKDLAARVNNDERNALIVDTYIQNLNGEQCIVYATSIEHAHAIDKEFEARGISSYAISGDMDMNERKQALRQFMEGKIKVLTNYGVLTEGFDYEALAHIINARPTKSPLLLTQIMGRCTRLYDGKDVAHFWEIVDSHSEETATGAQVFGFKQRFDCQGYSFLDAIMMCEDAEKKKDYFNPWVCLSYKEIIERFERATEDNPTGAENPWKENTEEAYNRFDNRYRYYSVGGGAYKLVHTDRDKESGDSQRYVVRLDPDGMGGYCATLSKNIKAGPSMVVHTANATTLLGAASGIEDKIQDEFSHWDVLLNLKAPWRKKAVGEPCTDKQWGLIQKFRLNRGRSRDQISKAQAMEMIGLFFNKK